MGAIDGHAKNFSLFITKTGFQLTPLYDIISIYPALASRQIEPKEVKLAMAVGDQKKYKPRDILKRHWEQTAQKCFSLNELNEIIDEIKTKVAEGLENKIKLPKRFPDKVFDDIIKGFTKKVKLL